MTLIEQYNNESPSTRFILELLATTGCDFSNNHQKRILSVLPRDNFKNKVSLKDLAPYIIEDRLIWGDIYYRLHPLIFLEALLSTTSKGLYKEYRNIALKEGYKNLPAYNQPEPHSELVDQLCLFLNGEPMPPLDDAITDNYTLLFYSYLLNDIRFVEFYPYINTTCLNDLIEHNIIDQYYNLKGTSSFNLRHTLPQALKLAKLLHSPTVQQHENRLLFLKGDFAKLETQLSHSLGDQYLLAGLKLLNKEFETAFNIVVQLLSTTKKEFKEEFPTDPLSQIIAALTITIAHHKKINTTTIPKLLKKGIIKSSKFLFTSFSLVSGVDHDVISETIYKAKLGIHYALTDLFLYIISKKFKYITNFDINKQVLNQLRTNIAELSLNWLLLELAPTITPSPQEKDQLKTLSTTDPITRQFEGIKEWELVLDSLLANPELEKRAKGSNKRVAYLWDYTETYISKNNELLPEHIYITPIQQSASVSGNWSKGQNIALTRFARLEAEGMLPQDQTIATSCVVSYAYGPAFFSTTRALPHLVGHPNILMNANRNIRVELIEELPQITIRKKTKCFEISANVSISDESLIIIRENDTRFKLIQLSQQQQQTINKLLKIKNFPLESEAKIKTLLGHLSSILTVFSDIDQKSENIRLLDGNPTIVVQLLPTGQSIKAELFVKPIPTAPPYLKAGIGVAQLYAIHEGEKVNIKRNLKIEKSNFDAVIEQLNHIPNNAEQTDTFLFNEPKECLELFDALNDIRDQIIIEWPEGAKFKFIGRISSNNLNIQISEKNNWFEMEGNVQINEEHALSLHELLKAIRTSTSRFVELKPGEFIALSKSLHRQLNELNNVIKDDRKKLTLPRFASAVINDLEEASIHLSTDKRVEKLRKTIKESQSKIFDTPRTLQAELRPYQEEGYQWMARLSEWGAGACLADDMGLGKTIQTIAILLLKARSGASLVVVPASVQPNWEREINRFAPSLNVININTAPNRSQTLMDAAPNDVCLITYGVMQTESDLIAQKKFAVAVLDEAHTIKNSETKASKAAMKINADFRIALTGTPIQNHLGEIWNLFQFTNPALLGSREQFNERFVRPIAEHKDRDQQNRLRKLIAPFLLRRLKSTVLDELPSKTEIQLDIELSPEETIIYETIRSQAEKQLNENPEMNQIEALSLITKLRMAACHIGLVKPEMGFNSAKSKALVELTQELIANNHRALVFSQFTSHLALIKKTLEQANIAYLYLDGSTPIKERERLVHEFQNGDTPLFLISLKAGGLGLNLTAADYVFHIDPWWNPAIENQASDRSHRIGQKRPVTIYRLVAQHTIEEKILRLHASKKEMADSLLQGTDAAQRLSNNDILELLKS